MRGVVGPGSVARDPRTRQVAVASPSVFGFGGDDHLGDVRHRRPAHRSGSAVDRMRSRSGPMPDSGSSAPPSTCGSARQRAVPHRRPPVRRFLDDTPANRRGGRRRRSGTALGIRTLPHRASGLRTHRRAPGEHRECEPVLMSDSSGREQVEGRCAGALLGPTPAACRARRSDPCGADWRASNTAAPTGQPVRRSAAAKPPA